MPHSLPPLAPRDPAQRKWWLPAVFALGLLLRLLLTWGDGTLDVNSWKAWAWAGATDGAQRIYGSNEPIPPTLAGAKAALSGEIVNRKVVYRGAKYYVDYPPLTMYYLTLAGKLYLASDPAFAQADRPGYLERPLLNFLVRLPSLLSDVAVFALLWLVSERWRRGEAGTEIDRSRQPTIKLLAAYWLNPALILALSLGYLDATFTLPLLAAVVLLMKSHYALAWLLFAASVLTKLQGVFLLPLLLVVSLARWRRLPGYLLAASAAVAVLLTPYFFSGRLLDLLAGLSYNGRENFVSGNNANGWWLLSYLHTAQKGGFGARTDLLRIDLLTSEWEGLSPRLLGLLLYAAYALLILSWYWRKREPAVNIPLAGALLYYGYTIFLTQVHENHLYPVFALLTLALLFPAPERRGLWAAYVALSTLYFLNMFLFYGLGRGSWLNGEGGGLRMLPGFDLSVPLAVANLLLFGWLNWLLLQRGDAQYYRQLPRRSIK